MIQCIKVKMQRTARMKKEIQMLTESPPYGISCWPNGDSIDRLEAIILGGEDTPYSGGVFKLEIQIPDRYPFEPPKVRFMTPIYHPNVDTGGRICLDTLKMPPKGAWKPCLNISTVLTSVQLLMAEPNPEDPLMTDISNEFKHNRALFEMNARKWTEKHAKQEESEALAGPAKGSMDNQNVSDKSDVQSKDIKSSESLDRKRTLPMDDVTNKQSKLL
ncbi:ubiquitin-conjugating enzyme E2 T-like isoform X2 [Mercenaria mercenaria]|uniref:ubiquitin-conjugating enzyme E2 T-like isoform X2 n=1 Tax=Mercenaria mercenaria TaxID=6596 RepID=UPI00234F1026|nr:ubiquitin-conjugating enzyme E2 T-like isoform X2 [Mercenaria mercenaria]